MWAWGGATVCISLKQLLLAQAPTHAVALTHCYLNHALPPPPTGTSPDPPVQKSGTQAGPAHQLARLRPRPRAPSSENRINGLPAGRSPPSWPGPSACDGRQSPAGRPARLPAWNTEPSLGGRQAAWRIGERAKMEDALARKERLKALRAAAAAAGEVGVQDQAAAAPEAEPEKPVLKFRNYVVQDTKRIDHETVRAWLGIAGGVVAGGRRGAAPHGRPSGHVVVAPCRPAV